MIWIQINTKLENIQQSIINDVLQQKYVPFQNQNIPMYDQMISLIINSKITLEFLEEFKNEYLKHHCYDNCIYIQHILYIVWDHTPKQIKTCNQCNCLIQMDYVIDLYKKKYYANQQIYKKSKKNLKKLQLCYNELENIKLKD